jgi:hypothetical protein
MRQNIIVEYIGVIEGTSCRDVSAEYYQLKGAENDDEAENAFSTVFIRFPCTHSNRITDGSVGISGPGD